MNAADFLKVGIVADDKTKKGITSAEKNIKGLSTSVKSLGKIFATVFAAHFTPVVHLFTPHLIQQRCANCRLTA
jgi:hypothetical protein